MSKLLDISSMLALANVNHSIVIASPIPDERTAVKLVRTAFAGIHMETVFDSVTEAETRRTLAVGLLPVIRATENIKEAVLGIHSADKEAVKSVIELTRKVSVLAATAMDALADGEEAYSPLRYQTYDELAKFYIKLGKAINDVVESSDCSTFSPVEIDMEHEPGHYHRLDPKSAVDATASLVTASMSGKTKAVRKLAKLVLRYGGQA